MTKSELRRIIQEELAQMKEDFDDINEFFDSEEDIDYLDAIQTKVYARHIHPKNHDEYDQASNTYRRAGGRSQGFKAGSMRKQKKALNRRERRQSKERLRVREDFNNGTEGKHPLKENYDRFFGSNDVQLNEASFEDKAAKLFVRKLGGSWSNAPDWADSILDWSNYKRYPNIIAMYNPPGWVKAFSGFYVGYDGGRGPGEGGYFDNVHDAIAHVEYLASLG